MQILGATAGRRARRSTSARRVLSPTAQQSRRHRRGAHDRAARCRRGAPTRGSVPDGSRRAPSRGALHRAKHGRRHASGRARPGCRRSADGGARRADWARRARTRYHHRYAYALGGTSMARGSIALGCSGLRIARGRRLRSTVGRRLELLRAVAAAPVTDAMLRDPDPADWLMYSRTYDAQRYSPLDEIDRDNVGSLAARVVEAAAGRASSRSFRSSSRRHVSDDAGQPRRRQPRRRARRRDRRDVVGVRAAEHGVVAHQGARRSTAT